MFIATKFKKLPLFIKILLPILIFGLVFWVYRSRVNSQNKQHTYQFDQVKKGTLVVSVSSAGSVAATNSRSVTTSASGVVKRIFVKEGQRVSVGTPILELDLDLASRQKLQSAYSSYLSAQNNLKTTQDRQYSLESDLVDTKNVFDNQWAGKSPDDPTYIQKHNAYLSAQAAYDNHQNQIKQAQVALESARLSLQQAGATVYAPISGTVSGITVTPGMVLSPASASTATTTSDNKIAQIKTTAAPTISVNLTEIDIPKIKVGNKATVIFDSLSDKTYTGKVIALDTTGSVSSGVVSYPAVIQLDVQSEDVMANMSATVSIITDFKNDILIIPNSAIQTQNGQNVVRILKDDNVEFIPVTVGIKSDSESEILSGLEEGSQVITAVVTDNNRTTTNSPSVFSNFGSGRGTMMVR